MVAARFVVATRVTSSFVLLTSYFLKLCCTAVGQQEAIAGLELLSLNPLAQCTVAICQRFCSTVTM